MGHRYVKLKTFSGNKQKELFRGWIKWPLQRKSDVTTIPQLLKRLPNPIPDRKMILTMILCLEVTLLQDLLRRKLNQNENPKNPVDQKGKRMIKKITKSTKMEINPKLIKWRPISYHKTFFQYYKIFNMADALVNLKDLNIVPDP